MHCVVLSTMAFLTWISPRDERGYQSDHRQTRSTKSWFPWEYPCESSRGELAYDQTFCHRSAVEEKRKMRVRICDNLASHKNVSSELCRHVPRDGTWWAREGLPKEVPCDYCECSWWW